MNVSYEEYVAARKLSSRPERTVNQIAWENMNDDDRERIMARINRENLSRDSAGRIDQYSGWGVW